jgi:uncharacterized 2Fe-2S/4Fe-4S cluster protein (DUF4445 family)
MHFAQLLTELDSGAIGQPHVQDIEIESNVFGQLQAFPHTACGQDAVAAFLEQGSHHEPRVLMIVDVKDASFRVFHGRQLCSWSISA